MASELRRQRDNSPGDCRRPWIEPQRTLVEPQCHGIVVPLLVQSRGGEKGESFEVFPIGLGARPFGADRVAEFVDEHRLHVRFLRT